MTHSSIYRKIRHLFWVFAKTVGEVTEAITHTAAQTGKALVETATGGEGAGKQTHQLIEQATQGGRAGSHSH